MFKKYLNMRYFTNCYLKDNFAKLNKLKQVSSKSATWNLKN